jgi:hypothetical protein
MVSIGNLNLQWHDDDRWDGVVMMEKQAEEREKLIPKEFKKIK